MGRFYYFFKPLPLLVLTGVIILRAEGEVYPWLIVAGLVSSMVGDVFLVDEDRFFLQGLIAFFVAHVCYVTAFSLGTSWTLSSAPLLLVVLGIAGFVFVVIRKNLGSLTGPVILYMLVVSFMVWRGVLKGELFLTSGVLSFMLSDTLLALHRFHKPIPHRTTWVLLTYYLGQTGIALSALY